MKTSSCGWAVLEQTKIRVLSKSEIDDSVGDRNSTIIADYIVESKQESLKYK